MTAASNQVIGIIDKAFIDMDHGFFADVAPNKPGPGHRKVLRAFNDNLGASDHFMQVAGIAVGDALNNPGKHENRGAAYDAKIVCRSRGDMDTGKINIGALVFSLQTLLERSRDVGATIHNALIDACKAAGVELGNFDHRILLWLCRYEPPTVQVLIGLIERSHHSGLIAGGA